MGLSAFLTTEVMQLLTVRTLSLTYRSRSEAMNTEVSVGSRVNDRMEHKSRRWLCYSSVYGYRISRRLLSQRQ